MSYEKALELFNELIQATSAQINYTASHNGNLIRDGRGDANPERHVWIAALTTNRSWKTTFSYHPGKHPEAPWEVSYGESHTASEKYKNKNNNKSRTFTNAMEAALYFVNEVWPAIVTMSN